MDKICRKIVVGVKDLEPAPHEGPGVESAQKNRTRKKTYADHLRGVSHQYHCPVAGCIYDINSERSFTCIKYLRQHYHKIHAAKLFFCERCKKGFAKHAELTAHLQSCGSTFTCSCGYEYSTRAALLTHAKRKMHTLPREQQTSFRKSPKASPSTQAQLRGEHGDSRQPTVIIFVNGNIDLATLKQSSCSSSPSSSPSCEPSSLQKPCFILPKPAPLDSLSAQAIAAMALSELSTVSHIPKSSSVGVQTAALEEQVCCCRNHSDTAVIAKRSAETQTPEPAERKRRTSLGTQATQTDNSADLSSTATQTLPDTFEPDMFGNGQAWGNGGGGWPDPSPFALANDKFSQTMEDLGVSVNFPLCGAVSSSTQTSPGCARLTTQTTDQLLDQSLRCYLGMDNLPSLQDYAVDSPGDTVRQLSSQTLGDDSDAEDDAAILSTNIHTQTSAEDLESITLHQLLSNMETQTSDSFLFPDLSGLCDIQTQTAQDGSPSLVDTHTQTHRDGLLGFAAPQSNMETQTFLSFLEGGDAALTDSHTQTSTSIMALLDYCSGSEDA